MATLSSYFVQSPINHNGKAYNRGSLIQLSDEDAGRLILLGSVTIASSSPEAAVVAAATPIALGASTIAKMNLTELTDYAKAHGIELEADWSKDQITTAITAVLPK